MNAYKFVNTSLSNQQDLESRDPQIYRWTIDVRKRGMRVNTHFWARLARDSLALLARMFVCFLSFSVETQARGERVSVGRNTSVGDIGGAVVRARPSLRAPP